MRGREQRRGRSWHLLQTASFIGVVIVLAVVLYTSVVARREQRAELDRVATATAEARLARTAAPWTVTAARATATARVLRALQSTPLPEPGEAITVENAAQVQQRARWGRGVLETLAWSPDGGVLAVGTSVGVHLYDADTQQELGDLDMPGAVSALAFSPDGRVLAVGTTGREVTLWQMADRTRLRPLEAMPGPVRALLVTPEGTLLAAGESAHEGGGVWLWREGQGVVLNIVDGEQSYLLPQAAISPDGRLFAFDLDGRLQLWQVPDGVLVGRLGGPMPGLSGLVFSPDGQHLASASWSSTVDLWQARDGALLRTLEEGMGWVGGVAFSPDGRSLASLGTQTVRLLSVPEGSLLGVLELPAGSGVMPSSREAAFSPDGRILSVGMVAEAQLVFLQVVDGEMLATSPGYASRLNSAAVSPDGRLVAAGSVEGTAWIWDAATGNVLHVLPQDAAVTSVGGRGVSFSPDGRVLAMASRAGTVLVWQVVDGELRPESVVRENLGLAGADVGSLAFSPDGQVLAAGTTDGTTVLWSAEGTSTLRPLGPDQAPYQSTVWSVAFSPDGRTLATGDLGGFVGVWSVADGTLGHGLEQSVGSTGVVAFSPDGAILATGAAGTVQLWRVEDWVLLRALDGGETIALSLAFSPDGQLLAVGSLEGALRLWQVADGQLLRVLEGHTQAISSLAFTADGTLLVSASFDGTVRLWGVP